MVIAPACCCTRASSASQRWLNWKIGLTATACASAPGTLPTCGVEPMLIDTRS